MARLLLTTILVLTVLCSSSFAGDYDALLAKVPADANIVMLLDTQLLFDNPIAKKEQWREKYEQAFASGIGHISPDVAHLVLASQTNLELKQPTWQMAAAEVKVPVSLSRLARERKGAPDQIGDRPAVAFSNDTYLIEFSPSVLAIMTPANRQAVSRWAASTQQGKPQLSQFLSKALAEADKDAIVQAIDLQYAVPPDVIRNWLAASKSVGSRKDDLPNIARVLSSIIGVVNEIRLSDRITARTIINFSEDAAPLAPHAKAIFIEILQNNGLMIEEFPDWNVEARGTKLEFKGNLSTKSLKRILSMMDQSLADMAVPVEKRGEEEKYNKEKAQLEATLKYYQGVKSRLQELKEEVDDAATWGHMAQWMDYDARQIDRLPQLDVDPELLDYGLYISTMLRDASAALRGIGINSGARKAQVIPEGRAQVNAGYSYGYGYYASGYYEWRDVQAERRAITADEKAKGAKDTRSIIALIQDANAKIRRRMTEKYHTEFR